MKYCPYCGAGLPDGTVLFCPECGKSLPGEKKKSELPDANRKRNCVQRNVPESAQSLFWILLLMKHRQRMIMMDIMMISFQ